MKKLKTITEFKKQNKSLTLEKKQFIRGGSTGSFQTDYKSTAASSQGGDTDCAECTYPDGGSPLVYFITGN